MKWKELNEMKYTPADVKRLAMNALNQLIKIGTSGKLPPVYDNNIDTFLGDWFQDLPWTHQGTIEALELILKDKKMDQVQKDWFKHFKYNIKKDFQKEIQHTKTEMNQ